MKDLDEALERRNALTDLRRLTGIILENLEEGSRNRTLDPKDLRMLGGTVIRSVRLFLKTIEADNEKRHDESKSDDGERLGFEDQTRAEENKGD